MILRAADNLIHPYSTKITTTTTTHNVLIHTDPLSSLPPGPVGTILAASMLFLSTSARTAGDNACSDVHSNIVMVTS